ncbi:Trk family potassium uptake protein [Candidatus Aerophobetes bacterium]|uniref:Trk family potassium uptake protein n=2 Tax=Aerophobetes bacterium TaxID=2030807 RepID=A0A662DAF3_UNCAE|nr:MAG: Trk family potassium uptake protein [Candidatus Aerophobetes bacterium]
MLKVPQISRWILHFRISPPASVAVTFLIIIALGTALLLLPVASVSGKSTEFLNALFTATSATCVTGLIVVDTGSYFSLFGQIVILVLIQIGGLGLMTFASFFALLSKDFGVRDRVILRDVVRYDNLSKIGYLLLSVLLLTFIFEAIGAVILYFQFLPEIKNKALSIYSAIFHSVSAFCNAGFSIYSNSFMGYQGNIGINLTMSFLIIFGGLGFVVIVDLLRILLSWIKKQKREHLSLHSKMVLLTTGILIGLGATLLYMGEMDAVLKGLSVKEKILISCFQSITARTAGFNTVKISNLTVFSSFLLIILMFIGASPGSTGGGIKTSTFATLLFTIKSMVQGKGQVEAFKRTIPRITVYQALCVVILALGWLSLSTLFLSFTEKANFIDILFEVFSAFGTVGLSRGLTPHLTKWGKIIIIITMIVGRIGPLTLALAIAGRRAVKLYEYPEEKIIIG